MVAAHHRAWSAREEGGKRTAVHGSPASGDGEAASEKGGGAWVDEAAGSAGVERTEVDEVGDGAERGGDASGKVPGG